MHSQKIQYVNEPLADILGLAGRELISLVGAGGKTSLMFALGKELAFSEQRVLVTTTTHIFRPPGEVILEANPSALIKRLSGRPVPGEMIVLAKGENPSTGGSKLSGLAAEDIDSLWTAGVAEYILVEADGAKRRPIKAPRSHEPVVPAQTTAVIGLIGLSALDREGDEKTVFGFEEFKEITGIEPGEPIRPEQAALLITHPKGLFKSAPAEAMRVVLLNQAETGEARLAGLDIVRLLGKSRFNGRAVVGSIQKGLFEVFDL